LYHRVLPKQSIVPAAHTATATGTSVDTAGFESATIYIDAGVITDGSHVITLQDSPDNSTWTTNTTDLLGSTPTLTTGANNGGSAVSSFGYKGGARYIRVVSTVSGATTGGVYGASITLSHARHNDVQTTQE
jgi:hypothetical protein